MIAYTHKTRNLTKPIYVCLGEQFREARKRTHRSANYLAKMLDCSVSTIYNYEFGNTTMSVEVYEYLCSLLGMDPDETLLTAYRKAYFGLKRYAKADANNK